MTPKIKNFFAILKTTAIRWWERDPFKESAVIAYYAIFALPGLLVVIITLAGYFFGEEAVHGQISGQITAVMGADTALQIQDIIAKATQSRNSVWATIIGITTILVGATGVFVEFQKSLNNIWNVQATVAKSGILSYLKTRLFSFGIIIAIAFILIISLVISAGLAAFGNWITQYFSTAFLIVLQVLNFMVSLGILSVLFAGMFKLFPDAQIKWKHVWIGSFVTALLFETGKFALGLYFGQANPGSGYGAAGSIILILLWASYSSMIVFFGAEFTHTYAEKTDAKVPADEHGVKVVEVKIKVEDE
ncbi:YihY/virulence factor BrkB family protein [Flavobacterium terrisoli]|uniref:YihY/virulence factor BrkB family protein n=1 Tax=Flavobacterium terrisoli TaxID=3242195 RepID=UPI002543E98D|nr:YihY/virulence factor BrkB family protein [Flavobacterium buctense]